MKRFFLSLALGLGLATAVAADIGLVLRLETALAGLGYRPGAVDGRIDQATYDAIFAYQRDRGLTGTGGINLEELQALEREYAQVTATRPATPLVQQPPAARFLQDGSHNCLNMSAIFTVDKAACNQLLVAALEASGCSSTNIKVSLPICFGGNLRSKVNRRPIVAALATFRKNYAAALNAPRLDQNAATVTFMVGNQPFEIPQAFERGVLGSGFFSYRRAVRIWSNLQPLTPCPDDAFILVQLNGAKKRDFWNGPDPKLDLARTISKTVRQNARKVCVGERGYRVIVHGFHGNTYIATTIVPEMEILTDVSGVGSTFIFNNFTPQIENYAGRLK